MKYYQATKQLEGLSAPAELNYLIVKNELFTPSEYKKYKLGKLAACFRVVEASRKQTFFSFGCRFNADLECF